MSVQPSFLMVPSGGWRELKLVPTVGGATHSVVKLVPTAPAPVQPSQFVGINSGAVAMPNFNMVTMLNTASSSGGTITPVVNQINTSHGWSRPQGLTITMTNFRQWGYCRVMLPLDGVTLIKGDSGDGKTTVFQAIAWTFYGGLQHVHPQHLDDKKIKTMVNITLPISFRGVPGMLTVERWRNPGRLMCNHSSNPIIYEDDAAQQIINEIFGTAMVWNAASYLTQKEYNNFLTAPNSEKMELLNSLAFDQDDPEYYMDRIHQAIDVAMTRYQALLQAYQMYHTFYQQQVNCYPNALLLTTEQYSQIIQLQQQYTQQLKDYQNQQLTREQQLRLQHSYTTELASLVTPTLPSILQSTNLETELQSYHCTITDALTKLPPWLVLCKQRDLIAQQLAAIAVSSNDPLTSYSDSDYHHAIEMEQAYHRQAQICQSYQLPYHQADITSKISTITELLQLQPVLVNRYKLQVVQHRMTQLNESPLSEPVLPHLPELLQQKLEVPVMHDDVTSELEEKGKRLQMEKAMVTDRLRLIEAALTCPKCETPLQLHEHRLVPLTDNSSVNVNELHQQIKSIDEQLLATDKIIMEHRQHYQIAVQKYQQELHLQQSKNERILQERSHLERAHLQAVTVYQQQRTELQRLTDEHTVLKQELAKFQTVPIGDSSNNSKILSANEHAHYQHQLTQLQNVVFLTLPEVSSEQIRKAMLIQQQLLRRRQLEDEHTAIIGQLPECMVPITTAILEKCINSVRQYQIAIDSYQQECQRIQGKREVLEGQIKNLVIPADCQNDITQVQDYLRQYAILLQRHQEAVKLEELSNQLKSKLQEVTDAQQVLAHHHQLRDCIVETYCQALDEVVAIINDQMQERCMLLFDDPMTVILALHKLQKSSKLLKPAVNFSVAYKGGNFDGIKQLSGGEKDRISLAVTLALSRLTQCPFILLDESLTSLDANRRDAVVEMFKSHGIAVWLIMHDAVEGMFDEVITVSQIGQKALLE